MKTKSEPSGAASKSTRGAGDHRKRKIALIALSIVGVAVVAVVVGISQGVLGAPGALASDADRANAVMMSAPTDVANAVPTQYGETFANDFSAAFPEGTAVNPIVDTWTADGIAGGSMTVELTVDAEVTTMRAVFGLIDDAWLLITMDEVN